MSIFLFGGLFIILIENGCFLEIIFLGENLLENILFWNYLKCDLVWCKLYKLRKIYGIIKDYLILSLKVYLFKM